MFSFRLAAAAGAVALLSQLTSTVLAMEFQTLHTAHSLSPPLTARADNSSNPDFSNEELYNLTANFWTNFMSPLNCAQSKQINSPLLAPDIQGRIDVTRNFVGSELNTEYLFGLFCNLQSSGSNASAASSAFNILGVPQSWNFTQFAARGNLVANTVLVEFFIESLNITQPVAINSFITFNAAGQIAAYDAIFKWFDWQFASLFSTAGAALGTNSTAATQSIIANLLTQNICSVSQQYCTGSLQQYDSQSACMDFLTTQIPFGEAWQLGMNVLACRDIHVNMVPFRPDVHCPHIGPSGGGYCTDDREYKSYVTDPFFGEGSGMLQTP